MKAEHSSVASSVPKLAAASLVGHDGPVHCIDFTADGKYCVTGGQDRTVRLWNPLRLDPAFYSKEDRPHLDVSASAAPPRALPMQAYSNALTHPISAVCCVKPSANNQSEQVLAATEKTMILTDLVTAKFVMKWSNHHSGRINCLAATSDGHALLSGSYDGTVAIWDGRAQSSYKPIQVLDQATDSVTDIHLTHDFTDKHDPVGIIRTASVDGCVRTYDLRKGLVSTDQVGAPITSMKGTKDDQCLAVSCTDGIIRLMDAAAGANSLDAHNSKMDLLNTFSGQHKAGTYGLQVDVMADDTTILTGSEDGSAVLYDLVRATPIQKLYPMSSNDVICTQQKAAKSNPTICVRAHPVHKSVAITASHHYDHTAPIVWANDTSLWYS